MEEIIKRLNELKGKKAINKTDAEEAASLLVRLLREFNDISEVAETLMGFHHSVSRSFFNPPSSFSGDEWEKVMVALSENKKFIENKIGRSLPCGFIVVSAAITAGQRKLATTFLQKLLARPDAQKDGFAPAVKAFENVITSKETENFQEIDVGSWDEFQKNRLLQVMRGVSQSKKKLISGDEFVFWSEKLGFEIREVQPEPPVKTEPQVMPNKSISVQPSNDIVEILKSARDESVKLRNLLHEENGYISGYRKKIEEKEEQILELNQIVGKLKIQLDDTEAKISTTADEIRFKNAKISELDEKAKRYFQLDESSKNQELVTLKNEISTSLRLQYSDFLESCKIPCNDENYNALQVTISQIFRALKRLGIEFSE